MSKSCPKTNACKGKWGCGQEKWDMLDWKAILLLVKDAGKEER
jgi:hypothetical protein